jgi:hypothetical protein
MARCAGIKRDGGRCTVVVGLGQSHCYAHDPARQDERRRNASRGGRARSSGELAKVKAQLQTLADDTLAGEVERGVAAVVNQIYGQILAAIRTELKVQEAREFEARLEELEAALQKRKNPYGT